MNTILARFERDGQSIKFLADFDPGYHCIVTTPTDLSEPMRVERFQARYLLLHCDMYLACGYTRLTLCQSCKGKGWTDTGYCDKDGEWAGKDVCQECQGKGGHA